MAKQTIFYWKISHKCGGQPRVQSWLNSINPEIGCACGNLVNPRPLSVVLQWELNYSMLYAVLFEGRKVVKGGIIPVIDHRVLEALGYELFDKCNYISEVEFVEPKGKRVFHSLIPRSNKEIVFVRGGENLEFSICPFCNAFPIYSFGNPFTPYVLDVDVAERRLIYPCERAAFLVRNDIVKSLEPFKKTLHFLKIPILEKPLDGLPVDLFSLPSDFRIIYRKPPMV